VKNETRRSERRGVIVAEGLEDAVAEAAEEVPRRVHLHRGGGMSVVARCARRGGRMAFAREGLRSARKASDAALT